jgi:rhamnogalacturonan endolyase
VRVSETDVYVGWRLFGTDADGVAFNLYRTAGNGKPVKLNPAPLTATTDYVDKTADLQLQNTYVVRPVVSGIEQAPSTPVTVAANAPVQQHLTVPLQRPAGGEVAVPAGAPSAKYTYNATTDRRRSRQRRQYEIVLKWDPSNCATRRRPASGPVLFVPTSWTARGSGASTSAQHPGRRALHAVHRLRPDGDGRAELACKTADGSIDGEGRVIGDASKDYRSLTVPTDGVQVAAANDSRFGKVLAGPEYLTIFDGRTGRVLATTRYVPGRDPMDGWGGIGGNGGSDTNGNRVDRFLAGVAYLDGRLPSVIMARGYYGRTVVAAWDWRNGALTSRWIFDSGSAPPPYPNPAASPYSGQGNHSLSIADVDGDGRQEIIYGSMVIDDDGKGLFSTGLRHGDALHAGDLDPARPGIEVFGIHENEEATVALGTPGAALYDARTGRILWSVLPGADVGRGLAADIDPRHHGAEFWTNVAAVGLLDTAGQRISAAPPSANFAIWWDADPLREILDSNWIAKWNWTTGTLDRLLTATGAVSNNGTKSTSVLTADLLVDWREEVIWRAADNESLRIYTTTIPATTRMFTLMHDPQYRVAIAWQNVGYNQPPHPSFFIGDGMTAPPKPKIVVR